MQILNSNLRRINLLVAPIKFKPCLFHFSSLTKTQNPDNSFLLNYLIQTFNFPEQRALYLSNKYNYVKSIEKPQTVIDFLETVGFSETQVRSSIRSAPEILFCDVQKNLKPKIEFLQQLGLVGPHLGKFLSKNSSLLGVSLEKKLIPNIEILKKILVNDKKNENLIKVITINSWGLSINPKHRLLSNIEYLESCGIVGSQLSFLLKRQPRLFTMQESKIRELVLRTLDMGFLVNSRMLVYGLDAVCCMSEETFERKLQVLRSFGFSKDECLDMFKRTPGMLRQSEEKLKIGLELFLYKMLIKREFLFRNPVCLAFSIEDRVIPRYRVLETLKSKRLLKKEPSISSVLNLTEEKFLEKFVARFRDDTEELLLAYKGQMLDSSLCSSSDEKYSEDK